jgi:hypothetical protein
MPANGRRPHEPSELILHVRRLDDGALRFTTPLCPGWAFAARRPAQIGDAIAACYREAAIAAYARLRGVAYDVAAETDPEELPVPVGATEPRTRRHPDEPEPSQEDEVARRRRVKHPRTHSPADWQQLPDGRWRSPGGGTYRPDSRQVQAVVASLGQPQAVGQTLGAWQTPLR